jgi:hypothetical protein
MWIALHSGALPGRQSRTRRGAFTSAWLVVFGLMFVVLLWTSQQLDWRIHTRTELQNATDAAAHAAARVLVTDSVFALDYTNPSTSSSVDNTTSTLRPTLISSAFTAGQRLANLNRVRGGLLRLKDNPQNETDGELYIGTLDNPTSRTFINLDATGFDPFTPDLNAVRVKARRLRVGASATYFLDRDVVGFRLKQPPDSSPSPTFPRIPMVPIAILSDPSCFAKGTNTPQCWANPTQTNPDSWENQIMGRQGKDRYALNSSGQPIFGSMDGIKEITITLTEGSTSGNAQLVFFDKKQVGSINTLLTQIQNGLTYADLPANNGQLAGQFLLNSNDSVPPPTDPPPPTANVATPATAALASGQATLLVNGDPSQNPPTSGLQGILGQPRIWMLYSGVPSTGNNPTLNVVGFVVARIMSVTAAKGAVTIVLQPSVLVTDTAITDWTLRNLGPRSLYNPYIVRLRFVE